MKSKDKTVDLRFTFNQRGKAARYQKIFAARNPELPVYLDEDNSRVLWICKMPKSSALQIKSVTKALFAAAKIRYKLEIIGL